MFIILNKKWHTVTKTQSYYKAGIYYSRENLYDTGPWSGQIFLSLLKVFKGLFTIFMVVNCCDNYFINFQPLWACGLLLFLQFLLFLQTFQLFTAHFGPWLIDKKASKQRSPSACTLSEKFITNVALFDQSLNKYLR
jgi:hypothetical protein